jgi:hypothetical protein
MAKADDIINFGFKTSTAMRISVERRSCKSWLGFKSKQSGESESL